MKVKKSQYSFVFLGETIYNSVLTAYMFKYIEFHPIY